MDLEALERHISQVEIGPPELDLVEFSEHDPAFTQRFEHERAKIVLALGQRARAIEHVGSTAVPGMLAKPIVDILVTVTDPNNEPAFCSRLVHAGYNLRVREPGHLMFRTPDRRVHLHIWPVSSDALRRHLVFRDYLRASADARSDYADLKRTLAKRWPQRKHYAAAKAQSKLFDELVKQGERWACGQLR